MLEDKLTTEWQGNKTILEKDNIIEKPIGWITRAELEGFEDGPKATIHLH